MAHPPPLSGDGNSVQYPAKTWPWRHITVNELAMVEQALDGGLDPNTLWDEQALVNPQPKGGCVLPAAILDSDTWPHYNTPLHRALRFSDFESAELLLRRGADVDLYNSIGRTALHEAVWGQTQDALRFLLAHGADVDKATVEARARYEDQGRDLYERGGDLGVQRALSTSDVATLRLLAEAGADLAPGSQHPWTALDLALLAGDRRAVGVLLSYGLELPVKSPARDSSSPEAASEGPSKALLAAARGRELVPPGELYGAYCEALGMTEDQESLGRNATTADVDALICGFFQALQQNAGEEPRVSEVRCASCLIFQSQAACVFETRNEFKYTLHESRQHLIDSAANNCSLCAIIADALDHAEKISKGKGECANGQDTQGGDATFAVFLEARPLCPNYTTRVYLRSLWASCGEVSAELSLDRIDEELMSALESHDGPGTSTGSTGAMQAAKEWLHVCRDGDTHSACREAYRSREQSDALPSRLLYIGEAGDEPRVVETLRKRVPYCALSYCRGSKAFFVTDRDNLSQNMDGIPLQSLPPLVSDAISVTRALGYKHIWIDALCIVHDDEEDWAHETAIMGAVYANADLTISTLVAGDCHSGLFQPRSLRTVRPVPLEIWEPKDNRQSRTRRAVFPDWPQKDPSHEIPVHTRGWTLQEQLMSTRILYFGDGLLHWECLHGYALETDPGGDKRRGWNYGGGHENRAQEKQAIQAAFSGGKGRASEAFETWKEQLEAFTRRKLTYPSDRLPAFASVSRGLANAAGNEFLGGIWNGDRLLESLCWRVVRPDPAPGLPHMPSWTWAAVAGEISFDLIDRAGRKDVEILPGATMVSQDIQVSESLKRVSGSITVRSKLCRKRPFNSSLLDPANQQGLEYLMLEKTCGVSGGIFLDHDIDHIEDVYAIDVLSFPNGPLHQGYGYPRWPTGRGPATVKLLLQKLDSQPDTFRRIGVGIMPFEPLDDSRMGPEDDASQPLTWLALDEEAFDNREIVLV